MGQVVELKDFPGRKPRPGRAWRAQGTPTVVIFTGVRYERITDRPAASPKPARSSRTPRKSA